MRPTRLAAAIIAVVTAFPVAAEDLLQLYQQAQQADLQLETARLELAATQEQTNQVNAAFKPTISASANYQLNQTETPNLSGSNNSYSAGLSLKQALYHRDVIKEAEQIDVRITIAQQQLQLAEQALIMRVAEGYFGYLAAEDDVTLADAEKRSIAQQLEQIKQRFAVGLSAITDVHEAQARYDLTTAQYVAAQAALKNAREKLREIVATDIRSLTALSKKPLNLRIPEPANVEDWVDTAKQNSLALRLKRYSEQLAKLAIETSDSGHYPQVDLVAGIDHNGNSNSSFGSERTNSYIGLKLAVNLYTGGYVTSKSSELQQRYTKAQRETEQLQREITNAIRSAYWGVSSGIELIKARQQALSSAQTALEATKTGLEVGTRTTVELLNSQKDQFLAQRNYAKSKYDFLLATLRLRQAAGVLSVDDLTHINQMLGS